MMQCDLEPGKLAAYLDGEAPQEQDAVRAHIAACPACAAEVAEMVALKRGLLAARGKFVPRADFRARMQRQMTAKKKRRTMPAWMWLATLTVSAAVMIFAVLLLSPHRQDGLSEAADLHVAMLASANPVDVVSTDRHTVKPWFAGRIPFAFNVPEFAGSDFALLGGKVVYFDQQPGAQLLVSMKQHKLSVLIFRESPEMAHAFSRENGVEVRNGFEMETWSSGGLRFVVMGDTESATVEKLAGMMRQANS